LATLHVHADEQPADDTDDRTDDAGNDPIKIDEDTSLRGESVTSLIY
jgi:hypothetical protein